MRTLAFLTLATLCLAPPTRAQEDDGTVSTEIIALGFGKSAFPGYWYRAGKKGVKMDISRQGIGFPIQYKGPRVLSFYENQTDLAKPPEGEAPPKPLARVKLPTGSDRVLLVFALTEKNQKIPVIRAYGVSTDKMKAGDYRLLNFSKNTIYSILNEKRNSTPPGKISNIRETGWSGEVQDMNVQFGIKDGDKTKRVYSSVWGHRPERRNFIFVFDQDDRFRPLDVRMFYDLPGVKAKRGETITIEEPIGEITQ
ncbi:MAG: hypothetical protein AAGB14_09105 [Verrucomicrobiota bacterium]